MAGVKGMRWGDRKEQPKRERKPTIKQRLEEVGADPRLYAVWIAMNARCHNSEHPAYVNYGARGITVCDRWRKSADNPDSLYNFVVDVGNPPPGRSLDRTNNDAGYSPDNVRWATPVEQARNSRGPQFPNVRHQQWLERHRAQKLAAIERGCSEKTPKPSGSWLHESKN
jgi:hypothetical protein